MGGYIAAKDVHNGALPHLYAGTWKTYDAASQAFKEDLRVSVFVVPNELEVVSPNNQTLYQGVYNLSKTLANGLPMWEKADAYLYSSPGSKWFCASPAIKDKHSFQCERGYITCLAPHNGVMPHEYSGSWKVWNQSDSQFVVDEQVRVAVGPPPMIELISPNGQEGFQGLYQLCVEKANGHWVWERSDGNCLYSGMNGRWYVATKFVKDKHQYHCDRGYIASSRSHEGQMPNLFDGLWKRYITESNCFEEDPDIVIQCHRAHG